MKAILDYLKWFFGKIFELSAIKMFMVLVFLGCLVYFYFQYSEIMKEPIKIKSVEKTNG